MEVTTITTIIAVLAAISGIVLGWTARSREVKKEIRTEAAKETEIDTVLKTDMEYLKRGVDDIRFEQRAQGKKMDDLGERVTRVEESSKQAHKRIDRIEQERG